ncbi:YkvA family protein [Altericista sp. CCNU0014]|uniref:YkvA family protein n=1 Tax=Altericista sp. CCNU0014 TaxID=3082949 RepID=UPI00384D74D0
MKLPMQTVYNWYRNTIRNPKYRWWIVLGTLAYLLNPIDISPDFLPLVGEIDDIALVTLLVAEISQIAIEKMKQRQPNASAAAETEANTVEVKAVSVRD